MIFLLSKLPYSIKGHRSVDYVIFILRRLIWLCFLFGSISFLSIILLSVMRKQANFILFIFLFISVFFSLYAGFWHTNLTSRQRYLLFKKKLDLKENERIRIIKYYIYLSFFSAILSSVGIIVLTLNNFVIAILNKMYVGAVEFLKNKNTSYFSYQSLSPLLGNQFWNTLLLLAPIFLFIYLIYNSYSSEIVVYDDMMKLWLKKRFFKHKKTAHLFTDLNKEGDAFIRLGINSDIGDEVILKTDVRRLHTAGFGPIGSGKSVAIAKPVIIQDAQNVVTYLKQYAQFIAEQDKKIAQLHLTDEQKLLETKRNCYEKWYSDGLGEHLINGFYVNEPSGDLIRDTIEIIQRTGFPEEMIWLVDPTKEDTDSINIFDAETTIAAGLTSDLIRNFADEGGDGNTFFKNAEQAYVRNLVFLLKSTARIENSYLDKNLNGGSPTLSEFYDLLEIPSLVIKRLKLFKVYRDASEREFQRLYEEPYQELYKQERKQYLRNGGVASRFESHMSPELRKAFNKKRDAESKNKIINTTYHYFADAYKRDPKTNVEYITHDANIEGMKNTIRKLASSDLVRRIFFSQSTKDIDVLLKTGGFLLVNTARGPVDDDSSRMIGQITDLIVQKGVLRRNSSTKDPFFSIIEDEYGWVTTANTERFLNQCRKYNTAVLGLYQNYEQVEATLGISDTAALLNSYRNIFVFQGSSNKSAETIVERAGTEKKLSRMANKGNVDMLAGNDNNASSYREEISEEDVTSSSELFHLEKFQFAGVHVIEDEESELVKVTPTPSFDMPIFKDSHYQAPFNIEKNEEDKKAYETWREQVERYYVERHLEGVIPFDRFTKEEQRLILGLEEENVKKPKSPKKPSISKKTNKKETKHVKTEEEISRVAVAEESIDASSSMKKNSKKYNPLMDE
ncbi:MAG: TraM recognition domain-containing protein [Streptococcus sp.]|nr:TraM recognition domain-containing protein [Streptococcus sp.]